MAAKAESLLQSSSGGTSEPLVGFGRAGQGAVVLPMPRVTADGHPMIDHAAGGRLGPAQGIMIGVGMGMVLWAGLLSLAWRAFH